MPRPHEAVKAARCRPHIIAALAFLAAGVALHHPGLEGFIYSDVVYLYLSRVAPLEGGGGLLAPYRDFFLEYPPLVGLVWLASVNIRLPGVEDPLLSHYYIQSAVAVASGLAAVEAVSRMGGRGRALMAAMLPSMAVYSVYNWDLLALAPALWGFYLYSRGRWAAAGILIGLGGAAKLLPLAMAAGLALQSRRGFATSVVAALVTGALFATTELAAPGFIESFYEHHANWYIEGSWLLVFGDPFDDGLRDAAKVLAPLMVGAAAIASRALRLDPVSAGLAGVGAYLLGTYVYTPQMNLFPAILAAASPLFPPGLYPLLLAQDSAAAAVILVWHVSENPLDPVSPASIATYLKALLLAAILAAVLARAYRLDKTHPNYTIIPMPKYIVWGAAALGL